MSEELDLKPCPFCGGKAGVRGRGETFLIVGCMAVTMLCPTPMVPVYKRGGETWDLRSWNKRAIA